MAWTPYCWRINTIREEINKRMNTFKFLPREQKRTPVCRGWTELGLQVKPRSLACSVLRFCIVMPWARGVQVVGN